MSPAPVAERLRRHTRWRCWCELQYAITYIAVNRERQTMMRCCLRCGGCHTRGAVTPPPANNKNTHSANEHETHTRGSHFYLFCFFVHCTGEMCAILFRRRCCATVFFVCLTCWCGLRCVSTLWAKRRRCEACDDRAVAVGANIASGEGDEKAAEVGNRRRCAVSSSSPSELWICELAYVLRGIMSSSSVVPRSNVLTSLRALVHQQQRTARARRTANTHRTYATNT